MANLYNSAKEGVDTNDVLSFPTECLGWKYRNLSVLIQLICSYQEEQSNADDRAVDTTIDSTSKTFDRHEEFLASHFISWRQGKFSWLEMVLANRAQRSPVLVQTRAHE